MKKILNFIVLLAFCQNLFAQYTLNGSATQDACNEYTLTPAVNWQGGSVWNNIKINLYQSFDFNFDVFLGSNDSPGADGIAFVLQPVSTSVGSSGGGMGYEGITPAVGVTIDTYQNGSYNDPTYDHIAFQLNGDIGHSSVNNIAGPVTAINGNNNIEDGSWHSLHIIWNAVTKTLTAYVDGNLRLTAVKDFVTDVFSGDPFVYWGFTAATGGENNLQKFKTALNPAFYFAPNQKRCVNESITFYDSTISFTTIARFYWDFGDGSPIDSINLNPVHIYSTFGDFIVKQKVIGADGCEATNTQTLRIGTKPVAGIKLLSGFSNCIGFPNQYVDSTSIEYGTLATFFWEFDVGVTSNLQNPLMPYLTYGYKDIKHAVISLEGCQSDTAIRAVTIRQVFTDFDFTDSACLGNPTFFYDRSFMLPDGNIENWGWHSENNHIYTQNISFTYITPGIHTILLASGYFTGENQNGPYLCQGMKTKNVFVIDKPHAAIKNKSICITIPTVLQDSSYTTDGVGINSWWWDLSNGQFSTQQNPSVTYNTPGPITIKHVVSNSRGCISDTLIQTINISAKPAANFGYSNTLCTGLPVQFSDSSVVVVGVINKWSWIYNGSEWSTLQNPNRTFASGIQTVKLVATSVDGCTSDTAVKTFFVSPSPSVSMSFSNACKNSIVNFTAVDNSATVTTWKWTFGDGGISNSKDTQHIYTASGTYTVKLFAKSTNGCYNDSLQKDIIIYSTNAFAGNDTITPSGRPLQLQASGGISYEWTPTTGLNNPFISNPVAVLTGTQTYTYTVRAYTPLGCESFDDITIQVYQAPEIYLPNAFTPNGDGLNDVYKGKLIGIKDFKYLKIFNRFGQQVFYTTDYQNGWDGSWKGKQQNSGVYVVIVRGIDYRGIVVERQGTVMLIR